MSNEMNEIIGYFALLGFCFTLFTVCVLVYSAYLVITEKIKNRLSKKCRFEKEENKNVR